MHNQLFFGLEKNLDQAKTDSKNLNSTHNILAQPIKKIAASIRSEKQVQKISTIDIALVSSANHYSN